MVVPPRSRRSDLTTTRPIPTGRSSPSEELRREEIPLLLVIGGERVGTRCRLSSPVVVGRDPAADLPVRDSGVSWHHARFERGEGGAISVSDLGSTNGTFVNEERVESRRLADGDRIRLGATLLKLELVDAVEEGFHAALDKMLNQDDLTGLLHRRRFESEAPLVIEAALAQGKRVALLVMDLDGIKPINDAHGHHFGATVIAEAGRIIGAVIGARGIATRFGGDEFAALLPEADGRAAIDIAHEVRDAIGAHVFEIEGVRLRPGISIGVAALPEDGKTLEELTRRADAALYRAKAGGKNRVAT